MSRAPYLIGITGPSGAGKSYLADHLAQRLHAPVLALDRYYRDLSEMSPAERARTNFDEPAAIEDELLISDIQRLRRGESIAAPLYDFSQHVRQGGKEMFHPAEFVILEGLLTLHWSRLRELLDSAIYVDAPDDLCLQRRLERDVRDRGRSPESVKQQFYDTVLPMAERHVRPSLVHAHIVVSGTTSVSASIDRVMQHLKDQRSRTSYLATSHNISFR